MMVTRRTRQFGSRLICALALVASVGGAGPVHADQDQPALKLNKVQQRLVSGFADLQLNHPEIASGAAQAADGDEQDRAGNGVRDTGDDRRLWPFYFPTEDDNCPQNRGSNIRVNQDCQNISDPSLSGRGQAQNETSIAFDPQNPRHMVASFNDYRRGDGNCGGSFSLDGGRNWAEDVIPMSFTRGKTPANIGVDFGAARQYWATGGDTSVAFDTKGNAYFSCQVFNRGQPPTSNPDQSSALLVFRSTGNDGASWNFPGRYVTAFNDLKGTGTALEDKQLLTVDNHVGSPFQDRVYVSWSEFAPDGTVYIWLAYSADYGETFSKRSLVSVNNPALCPITYGLPTPQGSCNVNQYSQPFTGPDGAVYVAFSNFNNVTSVAHGFDGTSEEPTDAPTGSPSAPAPGAPAPTAIDNRNQILLSKSTDGGNTFSPPVKVSDYYELPDCPTYQGGKNFGRACVPEKGASMNSYFRATNYASGAVNPTNPKQVVVTFGSYINRDSNEKRPNPCVPLGVNPATGNNLYFGVKTPNACNNKILISVSENAGASFTGTTTNPRLLPTVNQAPGQVGTDQWFQWAAFTPDGRLAASYYDRQYGNDEVTGYSDISLSGTRNVSTSLDLHFGVRRVTSSSMPPPTQFSGLFWGDYAGLTAPDKAYPLWSDTRNPQLVVCPGTAKPGSPPRVCTTSDPVASPNASRANDQDAFTRGVEIPLAGFRAGAAEEEDGD